MSLVLPVIFVLAVTKLTADTLSTEEPKEALLKNAEMNPQSHEMLLSVKLPTNTLPGSDLAAAPYVIWNHKKAINRTLARESIEKKPTNRLNNSNLIDMKGNKNEETSKEINKGTLTKQIQNGQFVSVQERNLNNRNLKIPENQKSSGLKIIKPLNQTETHLPQQNIIGSQFQENIPIKNKTEKYFQVNKQYNKDPVEGSELTNSPDIADKLIQESILAPFQDTYQKDSSLFEQESDVTLGDSFYNNIIQESIKILAKESASSMELNSFPPMVLERLLPPAEEFREAHVSIINSKLPFGMVQESDTVPVNTLLYLWESSEDVKSDLDKTSVNNKYENEDDSVSEIVPSSIGNVL